MSELANASAGAAAPEHSIDGGDGAAQAAPSTETAPKTGFEAAFERAKTKLGVDDQAKPLPKPKEEPQKAEQVKEQREEQKLVTEAPKPLQAPERWPEDRKALFAKQPRDVQEVWLAQHKDWEAGFTKKSQELAGHQKFADEIRSAITPEIRQRMQAAGIDETTAVRKALDFALRVDRDPVAHITALMRARNIDPKIFLQGQGENGQQQPSAVQTFAPIVQPLISEIQTLKQQQAAILREREEQEAKATEATIAQIMQEKDEAGSPKFPHLARVADRMADMIEGDPRYRAMEARQRLETAYQVAVMADPELREELIAAEVAKRTAAMQSAQTNDRIKAAATVKPSASSSAAPPKKGGIEGAFERAQKRLGQR